MWAYYAIHLIAFLPILTFLKMTLLDLITAVASTATAVGVIIAVIQLFHAEKLAKTEFEDQFRILHRRYFQEH